MHKKIIIFAIFIVSLFATFDYAEANIVNSMRDCRNFQMNNITHDQLFHPGDNINFTFSVECPKNLIINKGANPTECKAAFGLGNALDNSFGYPFGTAGNWPLTDLGDGYVRCQGTAVYEFPSLDKKYRLALIYPMFTGYSHHGISNLGVFGEHILHTCAETPWPSPPRCIGDFETQTRTKTDCTVETRTVEGTEVCCACDKEYYRIEKGKTSECIGAKGICDRNCKKITNNCSSAIFVPAKTENEWLSLPLGTYAGCIDSVECH